MTTLYVDRKDADIDLEGQRVVVRVEGERTGTVPLKPLERVVLHRAARLSTRLLSALWENGTAVTVMAGRARLPTVHIAGRSTKDLARRLAQHRILGETVARDRLSTQLVLAKLRAQAVMLDETPAMRAGPALAKAQRFLAEQTTRLATGAVPRHRLRGIEGSAARLYFDAMALMLPEGLDFAGRNRRPPRDPVNACLSLGYTLLHNDAIRAIAAQGLDPAIGVYHDPAPGRDGLACDLVEPFRPVLDGWVVGMFRERRLRPEHFGRKGKGCLLGKAARKDFFHGYEIAAESWRDALTAIVRRFASALERDDLGALDPSSLLVPPQHPPASLSQIVGADGQE